MGVQRQDTEDIKDCFKGLEKEFQSTFGELIPGIIHDFASPLNGILGRSELLERRAEKALERIAGDGNRTGSDLREDCEKIQGDAGLLVKEANRLFDLFNKVAEKFRTLKSTTAQGINLSELVEAEVRFLRFYPDIKHDIEHTLLLDWEIPEVTGVKADYSIALSAIIRRAIDSMKESEFKKLVITTGCDDSHVFIRIEDRGVPAEGIQEDETGEFSSHDLHGERGLFYAASLLKKNDALFQVTHETGMNITSIRVPFR